MKVSALIKNLNKLKKKHGDVDVLLECYDFFNESIEEVFLNEVCAMEAEVYDEKTDSYTDELVWEIKLTNWDWKEQEKAEKVLEEKRITEEIKAKNEEDKKHWEMFWYLRKLEEKDIPIQRLDVYSAIFRENSKGYKFAEYFIPHNDKINNSIVEELKKHGIYTDKSNDGKYVFHWNQIIF